MASYTIAAQFTTISITTTGDDVTPRGAWLRVKNLGANAVSYSDLAAPSSGAPAAGNQSTLLPAGASGKADEVFILPTQKMFFKAATGATLLGFEELYAFPQHT
jgi:hypothetical protein